MAVAGVVAFSARIWLVARVAGTYRAIQDGGEQRLLYRL